MISHCIGRQGSPLPLAWLLDALVLAHLVSFVVDLHHVDFRQVRLHLLQVLRSLAVDNVENVLHLVGAHVVSGTDVLR